MRSRSGIVKNALVIMSCFSICFRSRRRKLGITPDRTELSTDEDLETKLETIKAKHRLATMQLPKMKPTPRLKSSSQEYEELPVYTESKGTYVNSGSNKRVYFC